MRSRRSLAKCLAQNEKGEEQQEEQAKTVGYEDEILLVWKQNPCPRQDEGKKAPRENEHSENAISGRFDRTCNQNKREKGSGHRPERTDPSERINKKDVSEESHQQSGQRDIRCPQPVRIR